MPCYDPRSQVDYSQIEEKDEKLSFLEKRIDEVEAMLCALYTESKEDTISDSMINGQCSDINEWYHHHRIKDINRLILRGLPKNYSHHEFLLWDSLNPIHKKREE